MYGCVTKLLDVILGIIVQVVSTIDHNQQTSNMTGKNQSFHINLVASSPASVAELESNIGTSPLLISSLRVPRRVLMTYTFIEQRLIIGVYFFNVFTVGVPCTLFGDTS